MPNQIDKNKPSETALYTALRRNLAHLKYPNDRFGTDHLADIFLPAHFRFFLKFPKIRANTWNKMAAMMPGLTEYVIARTAFFDEQFLNALKTNTPQIVLMGAGYDSRAYRFADCNQNSHIFELDEAPTQGRKIKCLKSAKVNIPPAVTFIPIDFMHDQLVVELVKAGFHEQEKTLFLWEGVTYYLSQEAVTATLEQISHCNHQENQIVFDYSIPLSEDRFDKTYGAKAFMQAMHQHHADEEFLFSIDDGKIEAFLTNNKLDMIECLNNEEIEQKYLLDQNGELIGKITGNFRFVRAKLIT
jgi:methyltransferase (TIGR00027 family)